MAARRLSGLGVSAVVLLAWGVVAGAPPAAGTGSTGIDPDEVTRLAISAVRLSLIEARAAEEAGDRAEAVRHARRGLEIIERYLPGVDMIVYEQALKRIAGTEPTGRDRGESPEMAGAGATSAAGAATREAEAGAGATDSVFDLRSPAEPVPSSERTARPLTNRDRIRLLWEARERLAARQAQVEQRYRQSHARWLAGGGRDLVIPQRVLSVPERHTPKRHAPPLYRGPSHIDAAGNEVYTAVYDVSDLVLHYPRHPNPIRLLLQEQINEAADREALRQRSLIFGGTAEDLAAGLPLLESFGGVRDPYDRLEYDPAKARALLELVEAVIGEYTPPGQSAPARSPAGGSIGPAHTTPQP